MLLPLPRLIRRGRNRTQIFDLLRCGAFHDLVQSIQTSVDYCATRIPSVEDRCQSINGESHVPSTRTCILKGNVRCRIRAKEGFFEDGSTGKRFMFHREFHSAPQPSTDADPNGSSAKRKKPKGKRAMAKWLKFLRHTKKKEYQRMTAEERILYKLRKAGKKEERLVESLRKIEPVDNYEAVHDPEILTPEEHFYFLKMGMKCKNYVPVGRRGIFKGVILNMHLHWKKHETLQVIVKTFTPDEVMLMAAELARLSGGIVLDVQEDDTIIMYRGKNYMQPPTEIMSPPVSLSRKKALDKSKYLDALRAVRLYIPRLKRDLEFLHSNVGTSASQNPMKPGDAHETTVSSEIRTRPPPGDAYKSRHGFGADDDDDDDDDDDEEEEEEEGTVSGWESDSLSDMFETVSDSERELNEKPLFFHEFEKFNEESLSASLSEEDEDSAVKLDEADKSFLKATKLLRKTRVKS